MAAFLLLPFPTLLALLTPAEPAARTARVRISGRTAPPLNPAANDRIALGTLSVPALGVGTIGCAGRSAAMGKSLQAWEGWSSPITTEPHRAVLTTPTSSGCKCKP